MGMKKSSKIIFTILGTIVAIYTLFPFYLVVLNTFKNANGIVANPVGFGGVSFSQLMANISAVVNNSNFNFWYAFGTSVIITVLSLVLLALFGGMAAWVICRNKTKWSTAIYMVFIASMIIPFQVVMLPLISTFRDVSQFIGISMLQSIPGIVFAYCGFGGAMTVFILTGFIKGIPYELEEAAAIDGAGKWRQFFSVTVPLITPVIFYNLVTQLCNAFQEFNSAYIITKGGPLGSTTLISLLVYQNAFKSYEMGLACAMAWILFVIVAAFTLIAFVSQKYWVYYSDEEGR